MKSSPAVLASLAVVSTLLLRGGASADVPSPGHCSVPSHVSLVGHSGGTPDPGGEFEVVVRKASNLPVPGADVVIDFSGDPDARIGADVLESGVTAECDLSWIRALADGEGRATFRIVGGGTGGPAQCANGSSCAGTVRIYADGILLATIPLSIYDLDGISGVGGADLSIWLEDFGSGADPARSDYDGDQAVSGSDLSLWLDRYGSGLSLQSGSIYCP